jgi:homospermidine synthase
MKSSNLKLPKNVFILGYGAIGKCFAEILLKDFKNINLTVIDMIDISPDENRFKYIRKQVNKANITEISDLLESGDIFIDLSTNIDLMEVWAMCVEKCVMYLNTAMEEWEDSLNPNSFPENEEEMFKTSLGYRHEQAESLKFWDDKKGVTTVFEHGMNPGLISHFAKNGLRAAAEYFLTRRDWTDIDHQLIEKFLLEKNYPKLAQAMGLHTIHCSEHDNQFVTNPPTDLKSKFYNTWSCRGFLTEGMVPFQIAQGSHEDTESQEFPRLNNNSVIMSKCPSNHYWAKSWVPFHDIEGCLIPHGEAYTIRKFFSDEETGYAPSQYYVYDFNPYAKEYINNLPKTANLQNTNPEWEVLHPMNYDLHGYDKVGALLIFNNNRGWWSGTIMDEYDAAEHFQHKFGPTVLQVAGGVYSAFLWILENPQVGNKWAEHLNSDFILEQAKPYLGRIWSNYVDLTTTHIKDCYKFESFLSRRY